MAVHYDTVVNPRRAGECDRLLCNCGGAGVQLPAGDGAGVVRGERVGGRRRGRAQPAGARAVAVVRRAGRARVAAAGAARARAPRRPRAPHLHGQADHAALPPRHIPAQ